MMIILDSLGHLELFLDLLTIVEYSILRSLLMRSLSKEVEDRT